MQIRQFNMQYHPLEDRLSFRLSTFEDSNLVLVLTRRLTTAFVPMLEKVLEAMPAMDPIVSQPTADPETKRALSQFEHDNAVSGADFSTPFQENTKNTNREITSSLLVNIECRVTKDQQCQMTFITDSQQSISLNMTQEAIHGIYHLLSQATVEADWNIEFALISHATPAYRTTKLN